MIIKVELLGLFGVISSQFFAGKKSICPNLVHFTRVLHVCNLFIDLTVANASHGVIRGFVLPGDLQSAPTLFFILPHLRHHLSVEPGVGSLCIFKRHVGAGPPVVVRRVEAVNGATAGLADDDRLLVAVEAS